MSEFAQGFKSFMAKPEGKVALGAAGVFVLWSWWKGRKNNASAAPAPTTSPATSTGTIDLSSLTSLLSGASGVDGLHDGGGIATNQVTGASGASASSGASHSSTSGSSTPSGGSGSLTPTKAPQYVTVARWTPNGTVWNSTLGGIAQHFGMTLAALLALPGNAQYRSNPNLVFSGNSVQVG